MAENITHDVSGVRFLLVAMACLSYIAAAAHDVDMSVVSGAGYRAWVDGRRVEVLEIPAPSMHDHQLPDDAARPYSAAIFDAEGTVTVRVESDADLSNTRILPLSRGIVPQLDGHTASGCFQQTAVAERSQHSGVK